MFSGSIRELCRPEDARYGRFGAKAEDGAKDEASRVQLEEVHIWQAYSHQARENYSALSK